MWTAARALAMSIDAGRPLPLIKGLEDLYEVYTPRHGQIIMIAGRSGTMKSAFAQFLTASWNLPTLYFAGDMSMRDSASRFAQILCHKSSALIDQELSTTHGRHAVLSTLARLNVQIVPESPITFPAIAAELEAWVELHNSWPEVIVIDNLMDLDGAESDYALQMSAFQEITSLARGTGAATLVLHHATDKGAGADGVSWSRPPARSQIKNGLSEKPEVTLTVGFDTDTNRYQIAVVKQRMGKSDPSAIDPVSLRVEPAHLTFDQWRL